MKLGNSQVTNSRRYTDWPTGKAKNGDSRQLLEKAGTY